MAMSMKDSIPFEAGQMVESKSFIKGYRGAWFRCKIRKLRTREGILECSLEYCDFPGEKVRWRPVHEVPPKTRAGSSRHREKKELMLRPAFPPFYKKSELPPQNSPAEVTTVVNDARRVGDLVDLWYDCCYWSGKIIKLDAHDLVAVELPKPPIGEGGVYKGAFKDLRPSLNWSQDKGWSVPISEANEDNWYTARLILQSSRKSLDNESGFVPNALESNDVLCPEASKEAPETSNALSEMSNPNSPCSGRDDSNRKTKGAITSDPTAVSSSRSHSNHKSVNLISSDNQPSNEEGKSPETQPDMIGESMMELEELANKIRWLKGLLQFGFRWSNDINPSWRFLPNT